MMEMKTRISEIMKYYQLSSTEFAKRLDMNASILSHIMSGRNKASLDVILRILTVFEEINPDWLLFDRLPMVKGISHPVSVSSNQDRMVSGELNFEAVAEVNPIAKEEPVERISIQVPTSREEKETTNTKQKNIPPLNELSAVEELSSTPVSNTLPKLSKEKAISRITVFYTDKTYQTFVEEED